MTERDKTSSTWTESVYGKDCFLGKVEYPPGGRFGPASLDKLVIVLILSGSMELNSHPSRYRVQRHHCALLLPDRPFSLQFSAQSVTRHHFACIHPRHLPEEMLQTLKGYSAPVPSSSHLVSLIELAVDLAVARHAGRHDQLLALSLSVFHEFQRCMVTQQSDLPHQAVDRAISYIYSHYGQPLDAEGIASACGVSRQHLTLLLKETTGKGIREHLWSYRIQKAHDLLIDTGLQLGEIAARTGFRNPYHLSRKLKEQYGEAPRSLRQKAWRSERLDLSAEHPDAGDAGNDPGSPLRTQ